MNESGYNRKNGERNPTVRMSVLRINVLIVKPEAGSDDQQEAEVDEEEAGNGVHVDKGNAPDQTLKVFKTFKV